MRDSVVLIAGVLQDGTRGPQSRLGHSSIQVTLDTYGHLFEGLDEAAADRLDAAYSRAVNASTAVG